MADTVASYLKKSSLDLPTDMVDGTALASLWAAEIDVAPPADMTSPPASILPAGAEAGSAAWTISKSIELAPGVEARFYFLET